MKKKRKSLSRLDKTEMLTGFPLGCQRESLIQKCGHYA